MRGSKVKHLVNATWQVGRVTRHKDGSVEQHLRAVGSNEQLTIGIGPDGNVHLFRRGMIMSMKPDRRARVEAVAHRLNAYEALTGDVAGFVVGKLL